MNLIIQNYFPPQKEIHYKSFQYQNCYFILFYIFFNLFKQKQELGTGKEGEINKY